MSMMLFRHTRLLAPLLTVALLILGWSLAVRIWQIQSFLLPAPEDVVSRLWDGLIIDGSIWEHIWATLAGMVTGYGLGIAIALTVAILFDAFPATEKAAAPVINAFWAIPKVALAPAMVVWLGHGRANIVALVAIIAMFPVFVNALAGLRSVDDRLVELYRGYGASRWHVLLNLKLPASLPYLMTGLQVAFAFAMVATCVMEFTVGQIGVGFLIADSSNRLDTATGVAAMVLLGAMGAAGSLFVRMLRRRIVFWEAA